jgi:hypothetical protein
MRTKRHDASMAQRWMRSDALVFEAVALSDQSVHQNLDDFLSIVIEFFFSDGIWPIDASEVERAVHRLVASDLATVVSDRPRITAQGAELRRQHKRSSGKRRLDHIQQGLETIAIPSPQPGWTLPPSAWDAAVDRFRLRQRQRVQSRIEILQGLLRASELAPQIVSLSFGSRDRRQTQCALMREPFSFTEVQANHVLDMTVDKFCELHRHQLHDELRSLRSQLEVDDH